MSTFEIIEKAVKDGKLTYKALVAKLCEHDSALAARLLNETALKSANPKIQRKKHRELQVAKFKDDKEAIKAAMKQYDAALPEEDKPKRVPPVPRKLTEAEKDYNKARNSYVKEEKKKMGDNITISEMKSFVKKCRADYDKKHKKSDEALEVVEEEDAQEEEVVEEEVTDEDLEKCRDELREHNRIDSAKNAAKEAKKAAEKADKEAKNAEEKALRKAAEKAAKKVAKKAEKE